MRSRGQRHRLYRNATSGRRAAVGTPLTILGSSLKGWWDFSDAASLFQLSNGTTAVAADADPIGYATDKSGTGNHLIQATADARPLYKVNQKNGRACAQFDGVDDRLAKAAVAVAGANATMFAIVKATANGGKWFANGGANGYHFYQQTANRGFLAEGVADNVGGAMSHVAYELWVGTVAGGTPLWTLRVNGAADALTPNNTAPITPADETSIGGTTAFLTGFVGEAGITDSVATAGQIAALEAHLISKWGIS